MLQIVSALALDSSDWATSDWTAIGLLVFVVGGILLALLLYFRTAFKEGGWKNVKRSAVIVLAVMAAWVVVRIIQTQSIAALKELVDKLFR